MSDISVSKKLLASIKKYMKMTGEAKEAGNAANRQKTVVKNDLVAFWQGKKLPAGTIIRVRDLELTYGPTDSEKFPIEKWLELYEQEDGVIDREQFLSALTVNKDKAKKILGEDQVAAMSEKVTGTRSDIRTSERTKGNIEGSEVIIPPTVYAPRRTKKFRRRITTSQRKTRVLSDDR